MNGKLGGEQYTYGLYQIGMFPTPKRDAMMAAIYIDDRTAAREHLHLSSNLFQEWAIAEGDAILKEQQQQQQSPSADITTTRKPQAPSPRKPSPQKPPAKPKPTKKKPAAKKDTPKKKPQKPKATKAPKPPKQPKDTTTGEEGTEVADTTTGTGVCIFVEHVITV